MTPGDPQFVTVGTGVDSRRIAVRTVPGREPAVVWLGGFRSDMESTKALALAEWAEGAGQAMVRFDYSGHGVSDGRFEDGTISHWRDDAMAVIDALAGPAPLLVGSSMGAWITLLVARALRAAGRPAHGLVLIAPAADFTETLMWDRFAPAVRAQILETGLWLRPSAYGDEPYPITRGLIEDGRRNLVLDGPIATGCPIHILQGMQDEDVPWRHAMRLVEHLPGEEVVATLVRDGDHRLSRPQDIARLVDAVAAMVR